MPLIPEDILAHLFMVSKALSRIMLTAVNAEGSDIFVANGTAAGQRAQHFMIHIIPRRPGDKVKMDIPVNEFPKKDIDEARDKIQEKVDLIFKQKVSVVKEEEPIEEKKPEKKAEKKNEEKPTKGPKKESGVSLDDIARLVK
jgi:preprotein translocase subunit SecD